MLRGNILAMASITVTTGVTIDGRALARTAAVTLDTNTITRATCVASPVLTTTTLTSSSNPITVNNPVTFTAVVTPVTGTAVPTGQIIFTDGPAIILAAVSLDSTGHAILTITTLTAGIHKIRAVYLGPATFSGSTSAVLVEFVLA